MTRIRPSAGGDTSTSRPSWFRPALQRSRIPTRVLQLIRISFPLVAQDEAQRFPPRPQNLIRSPMRCARKCSCRDWSATRYSRNLPHNTPPGRVSEIAPVHPRKPSLLSRMPISRTYRGVKHHLSLDLVSSGSVSVGTAPHLLDLSFALPPWMTCLCVFQLYLTLGEGCRSLDPLDNAASESYEDVPAHNSTPIAQAPRCLYSFEAR
ncbi:hypothetical protein C8Q72DRAFT_617039 [Fomitopsis betulina]|nr:hypothetical protein C8Q72DRAFT_617039 [Fomitopsis betulina]